MAKRTVVTKIASSDTAPEIEKDKVENPSAEVPEEKSSIEKTDYSNHPKFAKFKTSEEQQ